MKKTILAATIAFWCVMIGAVIAGTVAPPASNGAATAGATQLAQAPATADAKSGSATKSAASAKGYTLAEVARHAAPKDCWMVIHGKVYDFSAYIPQHPSAPEVMTRHCGKEATRAFDTKDRGRPHGDYAKGLLAKYELGALRE